MRDKKNRNRRKSPDNRLESADESPDDRLNRRRKGSVWCLMGSNGVRMRLGTNLLQERTHITERMCDLSRSAFDASLKAAAKKKSKLRKAPEKYGLAGGYFGKVAAISR